MRGLLFAALVGCLPATAWADARGDAKEQVKFGVAVAQRGLWREAIYRWERATKLDPTYAAAHNNLAIAYEHEG
ncbi:MAG TPA: tetratricopeptide repeat protein, partial [Vicinamibacterales bacterium]